MALAEAEAEKSNVPGRWQVWQSLRMPGNVTSEKPAGLAMVAW